MESAWNNLLTQDQIDASNAAWDAEMKRRSDAGLAFLKRLKQMISGAEKRTSLQRRHAAAKAQLSQEVIDYIVENRDFKLYPMSGYEVIQHNAMIRRKRMLLEAIAD